MTPDPVRWIDDPSAPDDLRADLARAAETSGAGYGAGAVPRNAMAAPKASVLVKVGAALGGGVIVAGLVFWAIHARAPAAAPPSPPAPVVTTAPTPTIETPVATEAAPTFEPASTASAPAPRPSARVAPIDPHAELAQLTRIRQLVATDPASALAGAADGDRTFARGQLHQEREVVAIDALEKLGRHAEAQTRAHAFVAAFPESAYASRMRSLGSEK